MTHVHVEVGKSIKIVVESSLLQGFAGRSENASAFCHLNFKLLTVLREFLPKFI